MRIGTAISLISLALASGGAGYLLRSQKSDGSLVLSVRDVLQEEYLAPPDSFSRVENTKNTLDALCTRRRLEIEEAAQKYDRLVRYDEAPNRRAEEVLERATHDAETAVRESEGTEQQLYLVQDLLGLLKRAGRFDLWTQLYLKAVYEHPTHRVVSRLALEAVRISKLAGQQERVLDALRFLTASPTEFAGRGEMEAALNSAQPGVTQVEGYSRYGGMPQPGNGEIIK